TMATSTTVVTTRTNYDVVGQVNTAFVFRSAPDGSDYIGTAIPVHPFDLVCIVGQYNAVMQITPRSLADFDVHVPVYTVTFTVTRNSAAIEGASIAINSQTLTTNASGVATIDLPSGTYNYNVTKDGYNTNSGSVVVASAAKAVDVVMTLTSVETNSISKLNAYPNPFSNEIRFDGAEIARVTITSIIGQVVMDKVVTGENLVETQNLSKGIYLVKFTNIKGESVLRKLIKE
ncbi:MAG TPA: T9SS type A sorting domain-containing protein, partial [Tenuifilaceae bacterium]|nr:T9SS type A sorting domain-containing protein [Tenuifilaceae bacterium]